MSCLSDVFGKMCVSHSRDHDRFLSLLYHLRIQIHLPQYLLQEWDDIPMCKCQYPWQTQQIHTWMDAGFSTLSEAKNAHWPITCWIYQLPTPTFLTARRQHPQLPDITIFPKISFYVTDGSRYLDGRCGGAIAIGNADNLEYTVYPVHIPIQLDHSFVVELYVAWILLPIRNNHDTQDGPWHTRAETCTDSQSYITALDSQSLQYLKMRDHCIGRFAVHEASEREDSGLAPVGLGPTAPLRVGGPPYSLPDRLFSGTLMGG